MTSKEVFHRFVPKEAVEYCNKLYERLGFELKIKKARQTKLGDYRYRPNTGRHTITVNNDLNPYSFLVTYLHEVAHLLANLKHGTRIQPHGKEWKQCFKEVSEPLLAEKVFDKQVLEALQKYFKNPKASSCADPILYQILRTFDAESDKVFLKEIQWGELFFFNKRVFEKLEKKRTRSVCKEVATSKKYLIPEVAKVHRKK